MDPSSPVPAEPRTPQEAAALLARARAQFEEGRLHPGEYVQMQERYGPLAEKAPPVPTADEARALRLRSALGTLGGALLAVAVFLLVSVLAVDTLTAANQVMLLMAAATVVLVLGLALRNSPDQKDTGYALLAVSAILFPLSAALAYSAWPAGPARLLPALVAVSAPLGLLALTHLDRREGPALAAFVGLLIGLAVGLRLLGVERPPAVAFAFDLLWVVLFLGVILLRKQERPTQWRWYEGAAGVLAALAGPLFVRAADIYRIEPFGEYTGMLLLLFLGSAFLVYGILEAFSACAIAGALLLSASALWMGGYAGDAPGAVVALLLVSAALIAASQLVGVDTVRRHFGQQR